MGSSASEKLKKLYKHRNPQFAEMAKENVTKMLYYSEQRMENNIKIIIKIRMYL